MNKTKFKYWLTISAFRPFLNRAARVILIGKNRNRTSFDEGRLSPQDVSDVLDVAWARFWDSDPDKLPAITFGNKTLLMLGCLTTHFLFALVAIGVERSFAIELIGDVAWKVYRVGGRLPWMLSRFRSSDPKQRMTTAVKMFLRFPFAPPGYFFDSYALPDGIAVDMHRCQIAEYMSSQSASDLCVETWCNLDFALAELWGGQLNRTSTLASGCSKCDFQFTVSNSTTIDDQPSKL
jgi:ubiquinone biosynthesis protein